MPGDRLWDHNLLPPRFSRYRTVRNMILWKINTNQPLLSIPSTWNYKIDRRYKDVAIKIHTCLDAAKATVAIAQAKSISFARAVLGRIARLNTKIFFCVCAGAVFGWLNAYKMNYIFLSNITVWLYFFYRDTSWHHIQLSLTEIKLCSAILETKQDRYGSEKKKVWVIRSLQAIARYYENKANDIS